MAEVWSLSTFCFEEYEKEVSRMEHEVIICEKLKLAANVLML